MNMQMTKRKLSMNLEIKTVVRNFGLMGGYERKVYITPDGDEHWSMAYAGAWRKGAQAALSGKPESSCPYKDHRTYYGAVTWSRAFQRIWFAGYRWGRKQETTVGA